MKLRYTGIVAMLAIVATVSLPALPASADKGSAPGQVIQETCGVPFGEVVAVLKASGVSVRGGAKGFIESAAFAELCGDPEAGPPPPDNGGGVTDITGGAAARFRSFGNSDGPELYAGIHDLDLAANRATGQYAWSTARTFDIAFSVIDGRIRASATGDTFLSVSTTLTPGSASCPVSSWNAIQVEVVNDDAGTASLSNVVADGVPAGSFPAGPGTVWKVTGLDLSGDFSVTATLTLEGSFDPASPDLSLVEFVAGCD